MTVIVGILCSDGAVIGSDSAMVAGRSATGYTIERQDGDVLKIEVVENDVITAVTGAMGLAQRFNEQAVATIKALRVPFRQMGQNEVPSAGTLLHRLIAEKIPIGVTPYNRLSPVEIGRIVSQVTIADFQRTQSMYQMNNGWGLGALFAFVHSDKPHLIDFDPVQFHPEHKGLPDPSRGDQDRNWRCVTWGAGSKLADAFLAHAYRLLFEGRVPTVSRAKLVVLWTIDHASRYTPGMVGGKRQLAVLEKNNGKWSAQHADPGETEQQLDTLEKYISAFREKQQPDAAAQGSAVDLNKELADAGPPPEEKSQ
jgi:hypothetical protein